jgi:predicted flap endonuclease-1-like 5' DNA nuclease
MSNATTPIGAAFEMQRQSIEQGRRVLQESLEVQQNATRTFLRNSISVQRSVQQQGADMLRQLFDAQLEAIGSMFEDEEVRSALDQQFERNAELTQDVMNAQFENGADTLQQLYNDQLDAVRSALDDDEVRSSVDIEFARFESTQDQAWDDFESTFLDAFDDLSDQQQRLFARSVDAYLDAQEDTERTTIRGVRQAEEVAETAQQQTEEVTETARRQTEQVGEAVQQQAEEVAETTQQQVEEATRAGGNGRGAVAEAADESTEDDEALEIIEGLGETYANRLRSAGIESIGQLAQTGSETVADTAEVSESRANEWITSAQSQS